MYGFTEEEVESMLFFTPETLRKSIMNYFKKKHNGYRFSKLKNYTDWKKTVSHPVPSMYNSERIKFQ